MSALTMSTCEKSFSSKIIMAWNIMKKLLLVHLIVSTCIITSAVDVRKRHVQSNHHLPSQSIYVTDKSTTNEFTRDRTVNHGLMGGHVRLEHSTTPDTEDQATWDGGLLRSSAGNGKEKKTRDEDDDKKTLAQQISEGRYSLIQNELFTNRPKRPGIISYLSNPEVPKDNARNLGGLDKEDIWMSENGLLVLRGGRLPNHTQTEESLGNSESWPPIDDYQAPKRQVRIPPKPEVPPPFPVQLSDNGPIQVLGKNGTEDSSEGGWTLDGLNTFNESLEASDDTTTTRESPQRGRKTKSGGTLGGIVGPFFPSLPPGAVFLPPPSNQTDYDDDDQSIYYPPPYSFKYSVDNATAVPPGPLVPGIILPPPPDFFSQSEEKSSSGNPPNTKCLRCTTTTTTSTKVSYSTAQKSNTKTIKSSTTKAPRTYTIKSFNKLKHKTVTVAPFTEAVTKSTPKTEPYTPVTPPTTKTSKLEISKTPTVRPISKKQIIEPRSKEPRFPKLGTIIAQYPTTREYITEEVTSTPVNEITTEKRPESLASYYFYGDTSEDTGTTTNPPVYFQETTPTSFHKVSDPPKSLPAKRKPYYNVEITPSQQTAEEYSVEVLEPIVKSSPSYQYTESRASTKIPNRVHNSRMLSHAPLYYQSITERPQINLRPFFTTPSTSKYTAGGQTNAVRYDQEVQPKPVYQYSFEAKSYSQRARQQPTYKEVTTQKPVTYDDWQDIQEGQLYDYETVEPEQRLNLNQSPVKISPSYETSTIRPSAKTTPNPAHAYYTKQDEQLLDDVTKEYFTNFGKKIIRQKLSSTTPIYGKSSVTERPQVYPTRNSFTDDYVDQSVRYKTPNVKVHYGDQSGTTYSLADDTRVNYQQPLPEINPDAEFLPGYGPDVSSAQGLSQSRGHLLPLLTYNTQVSQGTRSGPTSFVGLSDRENQQIFSEPISLLDDTAVNYREPRPPVNPDAEYIFPVGQSGNSRNPNTFYTYEVPGGRVYFVPPTITGRQDNGLYLRPKGSRPARRRRGPRGV